MCLEIKPQSKRETVFGHIELEVIWSRATTESGRVRSEFRTTFKLELVSDLFWSMELYYQGDNDPPSADATKSDYGVTTSIGWSF